MSEDDEETIATLAARFTRAAVS